MTSDPVSDYIDTARKISLEDVFSQAGGDLAAMKRQLSEYVGPCPACGGRDRFSINFAKGLWHCRGCDGGGDGLKLMANVVGFDLKARSGLLGTCEAILGYAPPESGERESEADKAARLARNAERHAAREAARDQQADADNGFRDREISKARGFWLHASDAAGSVVEAYLKARTGAATIPAGVWENLKFAPHLTYWHGRDARGFECELHCGPAMIGPYVDLQGKITGCHQTWIDMSNQVGKYRPALSVLDEHGARQKLPTKKMRGHKKGSLIPICGDMDCLRWLGGEGIESTCFVADRDGWRDDTFYFAAGDLGNMAGPADPKSSFDHPTLTKAGRDGKARRVRIPGPVPKPESHGDVFGVPAHVTALVLLADGDSEPVFTASAMARAEARLSRPGLEIAVWWPPQGMDWGDVADTAIGKSSA